jgi:hypothetical protein
MKKRLLLCFAAILLAAPWPSTAMEISGRTGFSYQSWTSDADEEGSQMHLPIHMELRAGRFSGHLTGGYAYTSGDLEGDAERSISGMLDTQAGGLFFLPGWLGLDWMAGIDFNLPTGRTGRDVREIRVMIDPDLVDIVSPGQGFNVNPHLGIAKNLHPWMLGLGVGYAVQGKYDYSDQTRDYDPGDILTLAAHVGYTLSDPWRLVFQAQYATFSADRVGGAKLLEKGDSWLLNAALLRSGGQWDMALSVLTILRDKARITGAGGGLATEARNSQGAEWVFDLSGSYHLSPRTSAGARFQYLYMEPNDYETTSPLFMGRRDKFTLALELTQQLTRDLALEAGLKGFIMDDDPSWLHPGQGREYKGWQAVVAITHHF